MDLQSKYRKVIFCLLLMLSLMYSVNAQVGKEDFTTLIGVASFYCHGSKQCKIVGKGITATGNKVSKGIIAVDPKVIPLRRYVEIVKPESLAGMYRSLDTGKRIIKNRIDIWVPTQREAIELGIKKVVLRIYPKNYKPEVKEKDVATETR